MYRGRLCIFIIIFMDLICFAGEDSIQFLASREARNCLVRLNDSSISTDEWKSIFLKYKKLSKKHYEEQEGFRFEVEMTSSENIHDAKTQYSWSFLVKNELDEKTEVGVLTKEFQDFLIDKREFHSLIGYLFISSNGELQEGNRLSLETFRPHLSKNNFSDTYNRQKMNIKENISGGDWFIFGNEGINLERGVFYDVISKRLTPNNIIMFSSNHLELITIDLIEYRLRRTTVSLHQEDEDFTIQIGRKSPFIFALCGGFISGVREMSLNRKYWVEGDKWVLLDENFINTQKIVMPKTEDESEDSEENEVSFLRGLRVGLPLGLRNSGRFLSNEEFATCVRCFPMISVLFVSKLDPIDLEKLFDEEVCEALRNVEILDIDYEPCGALSKLKSISDNKIFDTLKKIFLYGDFVSSTFLNNSLNAQKTKYPQIEFLEQS